jgi:ABC-type multidrug transport system ATPase subunit
MLRFDNLSKTYNEHVIFEGLCFETAAGCIALNDESGSGKSTLLGILGGTLQPTVGEVWIGGHSLRRDAAAAKSILTYVPEDCMTYPDQTGRAYLHEVATSRNSTLHHDALDLAERFGLGPHLDKTFEQMSYGTRRKLFLTAAVIGETRVLIADEPGGGLDASARAVLVDLFRMLGATRTVFFSSYDPVLAEACGATSVSFADLSTRA